MSTLDLSSTVNLVINLVATGIVLPLIAWGIAKVLAKLKIDKDSQLGQMVMSAAENGATLAAAKLASAASSNAHISTTNDAIAEGVRYVQNALPDALKKLGVTDEHLADIVTAKLAQVAPAAI